MFILGISSFYHDSAACLIQDGDIIAAAQEERFTRIKHDSAFPTNAIKYCLKEAKISPHQIENCLVRINLHRRPEHSLFLVLVELCAFGYLPFRPVCGMEEFSPREFHCYCSVVEDTAVPSLAYT